jgi:hypothetical protein
MAEDLVEVAFEKMMRLLANKMCDWWTISSNLDSLKKSNGFLLMKKPIDNLCAKDT